MARDISLWFLIGILAWAPFPLGSDRDWSWGLLSILVGLCWIPYAIWALSTIGARWEDLKRVRVPIFLISLTLVWATTQILPIVPSSWTHPVWSMTSRILHDSVPSVISLDPWRSIGELTKLSIYVAVCWMTLTLSRNASRAHLIMTAVILIGASYGLYAFILGLIGTDQYLLFYPPPTTASYLAGPFVLHNSFASFEGIAAVAALCRLVEMANGTIVASKGLRRWSMTMMRFLFGKGTLITVAAVLTVSALVATASRAGFFSTCVALTFVGVLSIPFVKRSTEAKWAVIGVGVLLAVMASLVWLSGANLEERTQSLLDSGNADVIRLTLWDAARRMIVDSPFLGLGLGTFQDAYPMYATKMLPFIMDKAHSDYLEFAAGLGLPAAMCWWSAILCCVGQMLRALFVRRRGRVYPLIGLGCTMLVALHSMVDFSLQMPAVAVLYSAILGVGLAQSYPSQKGVK